MSADSLESTQDSTKSKPVSSLADMFELSDDEGDREEGMECVASSIPPQVTHLDTHVSFYSQSEFEHFDSTASSSTNLGHATHDCGEDDDLFAQDMAMAAETDQDHDIFRAGRGGIGGSMFLPPSSLTLTLNAGTPTQSKPRLINDPQSSPFNSSSPIGQSQNKTPIPKSVLLARSGPLDGEKLTSSSLDMLDSCLQPSAHYLSYSQSTGLAFTPQSGGGRHAKFASTLELIASDNDDDVLDIASKSFGKDNSYSDTKSSTFLVDTVPTEPLLDSMFDWEENVEKSKRSMIRPIDFRSSIMSDRPVKKTKKSDFNPLRRGSDISEFRLTFRPSIGQFVQACHSSSGNPIYFPMKPKDAVTATSFDAIAVAHQRPGAKLLSRNIYDMIRGIRNKEKFLPEVEDSTLVDSSHALEISGDQRHQLWVDKYTPKKYLDLVGDERINREVLSWVKQWDYCVFKKKRDPALLERMKGGEKSDAYSSKYPPSSDSIYSHQSFRKAADRLDRPEKRILLLTGPPGLGKTTVAHVVALHAGYNIIEVNASDDRTGDALRNKISGALQCQSVHTQKPNLIIIDEIDGASASGAGDANFMKLLLGLVQGSDVSASSKDKTSIPGSSKGTEKMNSYTAKRRIPKKGGSAPTLLRPIICICNDQYAPVLRPLREVAKVVSFKAADHKLLAKRLMEICTMEGLAVDMRTLMFLCDLVQGDTRASLNTLQFLSAQVKATGGSGGNRITVDHIRHAAVGSKDMSQGLFQAWESIFTQPSAKDLKKRHEAGLSTNVSQNVLSVIEKHGDYSKLLEGCYENYLGMKIMDFGKSSMASNMMSSVDQALSWTSFFDMCDTIAYRKSHFELIAYHPYSILNFHRLFASRSGTAHLNYPRMDYEHKRNLTSNLNLLLLFNKQFDARMHAFWKGSSISLELAPYLSRLLCPSVRPVHVQVMNDNEKALLLHTVEIMSSFGMTFVQEKNADGVYTFKLDPPLEQLQEGLTANHHSILSAPPPKMPYFLRQIVSHEIDRESMRKSEAAKRAVMDKTLLQSKVDASASASPMPSGSIKGAPPLVVKTPLPVLKIFGKGAAAVKPRVVKDFFGRVIKQPSPSSIKSPAVKENIAEKGNASALAGSKAGVLYRYNEGFSNAVRNPMYMKDFFQ